MNKLSNLLILFFVFVIIVCFFLPWVNVQSSQVGAFSKLLTGKSQKDIASISGFQIPIMANSDESRIIITITKIFNPNIKNVDKKSFLIYLVPLFAIILFLLNLFFDKNKWLNLGIGIIGIVIFFAAVYKIKTTDLDRAVLQIRIGLGFWSILLAYLSIGIVDMYKFIKCQKK